MTYVRDVRSLDHEILKSDKELVDENWGTRFSLYEATIVSLNRAKCTRVRMRQARISISRRGTSLSFERTRARTHVASIPGVPVRDEYFSKEPTRVESSIP